MTVEETREILTILKITYPHSFKDLTKEQAETMFKLWCNMFADTPAEDVGNAVHAIIASDSSAFAPNIGQINAKIQELKRIRSNTINEDDAWKMIVKAIHDGGDYQEYKKLPQEIKDCITDTEFHEWGLADMDTFNGVLKAQFKKAYVRRQERKDFVQALPESVKNYVGIAVKDLKKIENDEMDPNDEKEKADLIVTDQPKNQ